MFWFSMLLNKFLNEETLSNVLQFGTVYMHRDEWKIWCTCWLGTKLHSWSTKAQEHQQLARYNGNLTRSQTMNSRSQVKYATVATPCYQTLIVYLSNLRCLYQITRNRRHPSKFHTAYFTSSWIQYNYKQAEISTASYVTYRPHTLLRTDKHKEFSMQLCNNYKKNKRDDLSCRQLLHTSTVTITVTSVATAATATVVTTTAVIWWSAVITSSVTWT